MKKQNSHLCKDMDTKSTVKTSSLLRLVQQRTKFKKQLEEKRKIKAHDRRVDVPDLPPECVFDIFIRLPLESLVTSRFVCKSWYGVVKCPVFVNEHLQRSDIGLIFVTPAEKFSSPSKTTFNVESGLSWPSFPLIDPSPFSHIKFIEIKEGKSVSKEYDMTCTGTIKAACNGMILLENSMNRGQRLTLLNPVTRDLMRIPLGTISHVQPDSYGLAFCRESSVYKLVHLFSDHLKYVGCEIMDVGSGSWRPVNGPPRGYFNAFSHPISAMGALHWAPRAPHRGRRVLGWVPPVDHNKDHIVSMRLDDETFVKVQLPRNGRNISNQIFEMGRFLGLVSREVGSNRVDVWVLRGLGGEGWEKSYSFYLDGVSEMVPLYCGRFNGELVFRCGYNNVYAYDHRLGNTTRIDMIKEWPGCVSSCFPHVNSLVTWRS